MCVIFVFLRVCVSLLSRDKDESCVKKISLVSLSRVIYISYCVKKIFILCQKDLILCDYITRDEDTRVLVPQDFLCLYHA